MSAKRPTKALLGGSGAGIYDLKDLGRVTYGASFEMQEGASLASPLVPQADGTNGRVGWKADA